MVQHKKFQQKITKTQKKNAEIESCEKKMQLNEAHKEAPKEETKESEKSKEEVMSSIEKTKFRKKSYRECWVY